MAYDALAESVRLIERGRLEPVLRLSRRRRFAPMAFDVSDDVAVTMFARRGAGCLWSDTHVLSKRDGQWQMLGGGGGTADVELLARPPVRLPDRLAGSLGAIPGIDPQTMSIANGGGVRDGQGVGSRWPWRGRWISYVILQASAEVTSLAVDGRRLLMPWHGRAVIASAGRRPAAVIIYNQQGQVFGEARLRIRGY